MEKEDVVKCAICGGEIVDVEVIRHLGGDNFYVLCEFCFEREITSKVEDTYEKVVLNVEKKIREKWKKEDLSFVEEIVEKDLTWVIKEVFKEVGDIENEDYIAEWANNKIYLSNWVGIYSRDLESRLKWAKEAEKFEKEPNENWDVYETLEAGVFYLLKRIAEDILQAKNEITQKG